MFGKSDSQSSKNDKNGEKDYLREESLSKGGKRSNIFKSGHMKKLNFDPIKNPKKIPRNFQNSIKKLDFFAGTTLKNILFKREIKSNPVYMY